MPLLLSWLMSTRNVMRRGLRRFIERDDASGLQLVVERVRNILIVLQEMEGAWELRDGLGWDVDWHDRKGRWTLTIMRHWRPTFRVDRRKGEVFTLDYKHDIKIERYLAKPCTSRQAPLFLSGS